MTPRLRVLLVYPHAESMLSLFRLMPMEPLGLERIAATVPDHEVAILDMRLDPDLAGALQSLRPQLVAISCCFAPHIPVVLQLAAQVKQLAPEAFVLIGGNCPSLSPEEFADPDIDALACGEGEATFAEVVQCLAEGGDVARVPGLILNLPEGQRRTAARPLIADLDGLPLPARHLTQRWRRRYHWMGQGRHAMVETARGCPYRCTFCSVWRFQGGAVRTMSPEAVVREIEAAAAPWIIFTDDNFLCSVPRARRTAELIAQRGLRRRYVIQARTDTIARHPELIEQWQKIGLCVVMPGLEGVSDAELDQFGKENSTAMNETAAQVLRDCGVELHGNFIVDPQWGREEFARLRDYLRRHELFLSGFVMLTPLPGTELYEARKHELTTRDWAKHDFQHAVLPTTLPLQEFYTEYASLWRTSFDIVPWTWRQLTILKGLWAALKGELSLGHMHRLDQELKALADPETYLRRDDLLFSNPTHSPAAGPACAPGDP